MALIEIDGLPINSMVIFHGYVTNNQMVSHFIIIFPYIFPINIAISWSKFSLNILILHFQKPFQALQSKAWVLSA